MMNAVTDALVVEHITKRYGDHVAVHDVAFSVKQGSIYGVLGPNGAGKSTTMRMINDIVRPDAGRITLFGSLGPGVQAAARIGFLPEERGLYAKMSVLGMVEFMGELRGQTRNDARQNARKWIDTLGLAQWGTSKVSTLSKGMQQKVQFACALIHEPELLILDEPWSGLDPINAEVLRGVVLAHARSGRTVLFSTHQMEQAEKLCDAVCIIARGRTVLTGTLADVLRGDGTSKYMLTFRTDELALRARTWLAAEARVYEVHAGPSALQVGLALRADSTIEELLARIVADGLAPSAVAPQLATLHDVFVAHAGDAAHPAKANPGATA